MAGRTKTRRHLALLLAGLIYASLLAWSAVTAVGGSSSRPVSVLCSAIEELCREWAEDYTRQSGIDVDMMRLSTGEALARLSSSSGLAEFDVWHGGTADAYVTAKDQGLLSAYRSAQAAEVAPEYKDPDGYWTGVYLGILGFCSNEPVLRRLGLTPPTSWNDLLRPQLNQLVSVPKPFRAGTGYVVVWNQRLRLGSDEAALGYLKRLDVNVLQYTNSGLAPAGIAARGEAAVAVGLSQYCVRAQESGRSDLVVTYPVDGTVVVIGSVAVLAGARNQTAAHGYADYAISRQGQLAGAGRLTTQLPTRSDIVADPRLGADAKILPSQPHQAAAARQRLLGRVTSEIPR